MISTYSVFVKSKQDIIDRFLSKEKVKYYLQHIKTNNSLNSNYFYKNIKGIFLEIEEDLIDLLKLSNITLQLIKNSKTIDHQTWKYKCDPLKTKDLDIYVPLFIYEWSLYPISFLKNIKLKSIILTHSLTFSTDSFSQYRAAVPDYSPETNAMVYCCKERDVDYIRNVIHHELFHFFDYVEDGIIYGPDCEWERMNIAGFQYGNGGAYNRDWKSLDPEVKGFLNHYSTSGVEEDKAEIFAHIMKCNEFSLEAECDIINNKIDNIKCCLMKFDPSGFGKYEYWDWLKQRRI